MDVNVWFTQRIKATKPSSPEKKSHSQHTLLQSPPSTSTTDKIQLVVTPGPLMIDAPKPPSASKSTPSKSKSGDGFLSSILHSPSGITAAQLSANKAAKRAASLSVNNGHRKTSASHIPVSSVRKSVVPTATTSTMAIISNNVNVTVNNNNNNNATVVTQPRKVSSSSKQPIAQVSAPIAARNSRIRDLIHPIQSSSSTPKSSTSKSHHHHQQQQLPHRHQKLPVSRQLDMDIAESSSSSPRSMDRLDQFNLDTYGSTSVYDINDMSGMATPYTVGSFVMDEEDTEMIGKMKRVS